MMTIDAAFDFVRNLAVANKKPTDLTDAEKELLGDLLRLAAAQIFGGRSVGSLRRGLQQRDSREPVMAKEPLPDLPCPRCGHADTVPLRNYGRPIVGDQPGTSLWQCLECRRQFDGPQVRR